MAPKGAFLVYGDVHDVPIGVSYRLRRWALELLDCLQQVQGFGPWYDLLGVVLVDHGGSPVSVHE